MGAKIVGRGPHYYAVSFWKRERSSSCYFLDVAVTCTCTLLLYRYKYSTIVQVVHRSISSHTRVHRY
jgi:hypothetical protein